MGYIYPLWTHKHRLIQTDTQTHIHKMYTFYNQSIFSYLHPLNTFPIPLFQALQAIRVITSDMVINREEKTHLSRALRRIKTHVVQNKPEMNHVVRTER